MPKTVNILYIDDNPHDRALVCDALEKEAKGFKVIQAASQKEFEECLEKGGFEIVLTDFNILGFEGLQVLQAVQEKYPAMPVIVVTGTGSEEVAVESLKRGAADYIIKTPLHIQRLPQTVNTALEKKYLQDEKAQALEDLRHSEAKYRDLVDNLNDVIYTIDTQGIVTFTSPAIQRVLGYSPEEVVGLHYTEVATEEDREDLTRHYDETIREGSSTSEVRLQTRSGKLVWLNNSSHILKRNGEAEGISGVLTDISEQVRLEQERNRLFNHALDLMCIADNGGHFIEINPAWEDALGWTKEELLAKPYMDFVHPEDREATNNAEVRLQNDKPVISFENRYLCKDGSYKWISWNFYPLVEEGLIFAVARDVTEQKVSRQKIEQQVNRLSALAEIDNAITSNYDLSITLNVIIDHVISQLGVDAAAIYSYDPLLNTLNCEVHKGFRFPVLQGISYRLGEDLSGQVALEKRLQLVVDLSQQAGSFRKTNLLSLEKFASYAGIPLLAKGQIKGMLEVYMRSRFEPSEDWLSYFETLGRQSSIAMDNNELFDNMQRSNMELLVGFDHTVEGWARSVEHKLGEPPGHTRQLAELAVGLAESIEIEYTRLAHIRRGALLHDIGMLSIPHRIVRKKSSLSEKDLKVLHEHPQIAHDILHPIDFLRPALDIPYAHHERWDGSGYPRGLQGKQIPIAARIFSLVDVWDALRSERPHRKAWRDEEVNAYLKDQSGKQFEPRLVEIFSDFILNQEYF